MSTSSALVPVDFNQIDSFFNEKLINYDDTSVDISNVSPLVFTASNLTIQKSFVLPIPVVQLYYYFNYYYYYLLIYIHTIYIGKRIPYNL